MNKIVVMLALIFNVVNVNSQDNKGKIWVVPAPEKLTAGVGDLEITSSMIIIYNNDVILPDIKIFNNYLLEHYGFEMEASKSSQTKGKQLNITFDPEKTADTYTLNVDSNGISIVGGKNAGVFYALQTLIQLITPAKISSIRVPFVQITDAPRFQYRGMHLDVSRHFFSVDVVKRYIDHLAMYKMNQFHWHLTDDQGWRIEIKKYPQLQKISAWRNGTLIGHYSDKPQRFDTLLYGGYYTRDEIKDVVKYAALRHINIIPEIEMPGHAQAVLAAYPELACTPGPFQVGQYWGVYKDVFCPKQQTFDFLENVLDEVCDLFPGKYIHIGGDECPKDRWKECEHCQALIKKENLVDENGLQRYFTNRIVNYLKKKNKIAIGWDEILEEGLDQDAVVMSWRGYSGGTNAALKGHDVVMSPASHVYFDQYQSRNTTGRIAIGGYLPLDVVYNFEPIPDVLNADQAKHILGAQANLWSEYITDEQRIEEMIFPRICALAEVLWSPKEKRDFSDFASRLMMQFKFLSFQKLKYSTAIFDITSRVFPNGDKGIFVELISKYPGGKIYYTINGETPSIYSPLYVQRIEVPQTIPVQAALFEGNQQRGTVFAQTYNINKATGKAVTLKFPPHVEYSRGGAFSLVDGAVGSLPWLSSDWLGFEGKNMDATIDLGSTQSVSRVVVDVLEDIEGRILLPRGIVVLASDNGSDFRIAASVSASEIISMKRQMRIKFPEVKARFIQVIAENANSKDWLFVDEIMVD